MRARRTVRMQHSQTGATYDAPESAVAALQQSGWEAVDQVAGAAVRAQRGQAEPSRKVRMRHPKADAIYDAPVSAVPALQRSGWVPVDSEAGDDADGAPRPAGEQAPQAPPGNQVQADDQDAGQGASLNAGGDLPPGQTEARNTTGQAEPVIPEPKPRRGRRTTKQED